MTTDQIVACMVAVPKDKFFGLLFEKKLNVHPSISDSNRYDRRLGYTHLWKSGHGIIGASFGVDREYGGSGQRYFVTPDFFNRHRAVLE